MQILELLRLLGARTHRRESARPMDLTLRILPHGTVFGIVLLCDVDNPDDPTTPRVVQKVLAVGFKSPEDAMDALIDSWSAPPPDTESLDLAVAKVSELAVALEEIGPAIPPIQQRLDDLEEAVTLVMTPPAAATPAKRLNPLLAGREAAAQHGTPPAAAPRPSIRRPVLTKDLPEQQRELPARVHGQSFGGPIRRGAGPVEE